MATWSLLAQKAVARRRAAIDFFLKTDMDDKLLAAFARYRKGVAALAQATDLEKFCLTKDYTAVSSYLNILELMAVGIENETFDERICFVYWREFLVDTLRDTAKLIDHVRAKPDGIYYYRALRSLHDRWLNNPELPIRWQQKGRPLRKGPTLVTPIP